MTGSSSADVEAGSGAGDIAGSGEGSTASGFPTATSSAGPTAGGFDGTTSFASASARTPFPGCTAPGASNPSAPTPAGAAFRPLRGSAIEAHGPLPTPLTTPSTLRTLGQP